MWRPFEIIPKLKPVFLAWVFIQLFMGQVGILGPLLFATYSKATVWSIIKANLDAGNFYTFAIALLASSIAAVALEYYLDPRLGAKFRTYKLSTSIAAAALIVACAFLFSGLSLQAVKTQNNACLEDSLDFAQLIAYVLSLLLAVYMMCVMHLHLFPEDFQEMDDLAVKKMKAKAKAIKTDKSGELNI